MVATDFETSSGALDLASGLADEIVERVQTVWPRNPADRVVRYADEAHVDLPVVGTMAGTGRRGGDRGTLPRRSIEPRMYRC